MALSVLFALKTLSFGFYVGRTKGDMAADEGIFYEGSSSLVVGFSGHVAPNNSLKGPAS